MARSFMASLGQFEFSLDTAAFQQLERQAQYRWAKNERIGSAPSLQFTGRDAQTINMQGTIFPNFRGGIGQMALLRDMGESGSPYDLVYSSENVGQALGLWCIESVKETRTVFFENGAPRRIDFTLSLVEYGGEQ